MIDVAALLSSLNRQPAEVKRQAELFVSAEGNGRRFVLGRNEHAAALAAAIDVTAFVDDFAAPGTAWNDRPVVSGSELPKDAIVINCSMSISPVSAFRRIESLAVAGGLAYADLCNTFPERFRWPDFIVETRDDIRQNFDKWSSLAASLADEQSQRVLDDLLCFRLTGDCSSMAAYSVRLKEQYFEEFVGLQSGEVFVDAGGYDGDTSIEFCKRHPDYKKIYLFEPSSINMASARTRLHEYDSIEFVQMGLSDSVGTLWFNPDAGSASSIDASGACRIDVTTLDQSVTNAVTFIKMDLEGWELQALAGCRQHILADHPRMAIAVYHRPSDFWRIPEYVLSLRQDYRVFIRHYTEGWSETVMYFVPK